MATKISLKAIGENASGKTLLLNNVKDFLENKGLTIEQHEHELVISGEICEICVGR